MKKKRLYIVNNCLKGYNCKWLETHTVEPAHAELEICSRHNGESAPMLHIGGWRLIGTVVKSRKSALRAARNMIEKINNGGIEVAE